MYRSFLVRVWRDENEPQVAQLQAEVRQIQSGESWVFSSREALLAFFRDLTAEDAQEHQTEE
jgi:hypothetical protein